MEKMEYQQEYSKKFIDKFLIPIRNITDKVPKKVSIEVTTRCQLDCVYCTREKDNPKDLPLKDLKRITDHLHGVKEIILCGMGETFCYPHLYDAVALLKDYKITIISNGAVPIHFEELNRANNIRLIVFSIDAPTKEKMMAICGGYRFDLLERNLWELHKHPKIAGIINSTLTTDNIDEIPSIIKFAKEHHLLAVNFELPIGNEKFTRENKERIRKRIQEGTEIAKKEGIMINPFYRISCNTNGFLVPNIRLNGELYPCCNGMNQNTCVGNVFHEDIITLWESKVVPLLQQDAYCRNCKLTRNLWQLVS